MLKQNLLRVVFKGGDYNPGLFEVTDKGRKFLKAYKNLKALMK